MVGILDTNLNVFVNEGSDSDTVNYAASQLPPDVLSKSIGKAGLVQKEVTVKGKHGTYVSKRWVKVDIAKPKSMKPHKSSIQKTPTNTKVSTEDNSSTVLRYFPVSNCDKQMTAEVYTEEQVKDYYDKRIKNGHSFEHFKQRNYFISNGRNTTQSFYKRSGEYLLQRQKLHDTIVQEILDNADAPPEGTKPTCFLYGGGSASGKSSVIETAVEPQIIETGMRFGKVDNDKIKDMLPEHEHFKNESIENAAWRVHDEASDITTQAIEQLIESGKNFCYDGTMKNYRKYADLINQLYDKGYSIRIVAVDIPTVDAEKRALNRAKKYNRHVKLDILRNIHEGFALSFPKLMANFGDKIDSFQLWDNSQPEGEPPTLFFSDAGIHNYDLMERFIKKSENALQSKQNKNH